MGPGGGGDQAQHPHGCMPCPGQLLWRHQRQHGPSAPPQLQAGIVAKPAHAPGNAAQQATFSPPARAIAPFLGCQQAAWLPALGPLSCAGPRCVAPRADPLALCLRVPPERSLVAYHARVCGTVERYHVPQWVPHAQPATSRGKSSARTCTKWLGRHALPWLAIIRAAGPRGGPPRSGTPAQPGPKSRCGG